METIKPLNDEPLILHDPPIDKRVVTWTHI